MLNSITRRSVLSLILALGFAGTANADFVSPFPSTVEGIDVPNTHLLDGSMAPGAPAVIRGMAPRDQLEQLLENGVTDFVIFKTETGTEVRDQIRELRSLGFKDSDGDGKLDRVHHFPMKWRKISDAEFQQTCEMTIDALSVLLRISETQGRKVFFHCTVGEDRTGVLAGLYRSLSEDVPPGGDKQWSIRGAFYWEMCEGGYSAGNPEKAKDSPFVVQEIDKTLTPFYVKMGFLIEKGLLTRDNLDKSVCARDPKFDPELRQEFTTNPRYNPYNYRCRASSRYPFNL